MANTTPAAEDKPSTNSSLAANISAASDVLPRFNTSLSTASSALGIPGSDDEYSGIANLPTWNHLEFQYAVRTLIHDILRAGDYIDEYDKLKTTAERDRAYRLVRDMSKAHCRIERKVEKLKELVDQLLRWNEEHPNKYSKLYDEDGKKKITKLKAAKEETTNVEMGDSEIDMMVDI